MKKINYKFISDDFGLSHISYALDYDLFIDIEISDFYFWIFESDKELEIYSQNYSTWDELNDELVDLEYDFESKIVQYINESFDSGQIDEFTYREDSD